MKAVRRELVEHLTAKYKESDLFKVYQTMDLGNLRLAEHRDLAEKLPVTMALLDELYGPSFRDFISKTTGCKPLSGTNQDCSANVYMKGGHLLCHDDVIGSRAVSYIIYLTDDEAWSQADGGSLELYALDGPAQPAFNPARGILPTFNTMAFFAVQPGVSYHQVQEVFADGKPRLSISGWFHWDESKATSTDEAAASRIHLQVGGGLTKEEDFEDLDVPADESSAEESDSLTPSEKEFLCSFVNAEFLEKENIQKISAQFIEESSVELRDFLNEGKLAELEPLLLENEEGSPDPALRPCPDAGDSWEEVGPPHLQHYLRARGNAKGLSASLEALRRELFASPAFARLLSLYTTMLPCAHRGQSRWFRRGLDYTVAHADAMAPEHRLDATLCVLPKGTDEGRAQTPQPSNSAKYKRDARHLSGIPQPPSTPGILAPLIATWQPMTARAELRPQSSGKMMTMVRWCPCRLDTTP